MQKQLIIITLLLICLSSLPEIISASTSTSIRLGNKSKIVQLKSGSEVKLLSMGPFFFTNGDDPALVLTYETTLDISNSKELNKEVDEIWGKFVHNVEHGGYTCGVIRTESPKKGTFIKESDIFGFVWEKLPNGNWEKMR